jgi:hypothetical protein
MLYGKIMIQTRIHLTKNNFLSKSVMFKMDDHIISCFVDSTCRGIQCALDVSFISRTFEFFMKLEPCEYSLKVGIERLQFERTLKGFKCDFIHEIIQEQVDFIRC